MARCVPVAFVALLALIAPLAAQAPEANAPAEPAAPPAAPRTMVGSWEFSNASREKSCTITFRDDARAGKKVEFDPGCAAQFTFITDIAGWSHAENDFLHLLDAGGRSVLEFSEVEGGIFEAPRPGEGILFIQNPATLGPAPRTAAQVTGQWTMANRDGKAICALMLSDTAQGEEFIARVQKPCDAAVTRFAPAAWQIDRGELVLKSAKGQTWRFEPIEDSNWRRVPEATGMTMTRK